MRGRKPTPPELRLLRGDTRKQARFPAAKPQPPQPPEPLAPPDYLSDGAKVVWSELAPGLHEIGWLTNLDAPSFGAFCAVAARLREVEARIAVGDDAPALRRLAKELAQAVIKLGEAFGLSPLSRTRLSVAAPEKKGKFDGFLGGFGESESA